MNKANKNVRFGIKLKLKPITYKEPFKISGTGVAIWSEINRKVGWVGYDSHFVLGDKFPGEKGTVRWCIVMMQKPVLLLPKFRAKPLHISRSCRKTSQYYVELTFWPARKNSL
jgi:hypothetical protein